MADEESGIASHRMNPISAVSSSNIIPNQPQDPKKDVQSSSFHRSDQQARVQTPVTRETLSELDVTKIIKNLKLRHDVNFDPLLHFRPNTDGKKGEKKKMQADRFWKMLQYQLQEFLTERDRFVGEHGNDNDWLLPMFLKSAKDILYTLVPKQDYTALEEGFNVDLIVQQISRWIIDLENLASWLSRLLKSHCAPRRDEWIDTMCDQLVNGSRTDDMGEMVQGLRSFLEILEVMRLDVANHQVQCLRPLLIEDTVRFEQHRFLEKIREHQFDPAPAHAWYLELSPVTELASLRAFGGMAIFFEELVSMMMPSYTQMHSLLPDTFHLDKERIEILRTDMLYAINLEVCMRLYDMWQKLAKSMATADHIPSTFPAMPPSEASGFSRTTLDDENSASKRDGHGSSSSGLDIRSTNFTGSSPQAGARRPILPVFASEEEQRIKSKELYDSLAALVQSEATKPGDATQWRVLRDSLALQIARFTSLPTRMSQIFGDSLGRHLGDVPLPNDRYEFSPLFRDVEQMFRKRLLAELQQRVKEFKGLTGAALFSAATGCQLQRSYLAGIDRIRGDRLTSRTREEGGVSDMGTRLAHLGLLHWRVWAPLVYLGSHDHEPMEGYDPTIEDLFQKTITIDGQPVLLELLDTAGQEEYETFRDEWIRQSHGAVVVYDVTRKASFKKVEPLIEQVIKVKEWRSDTAYHQLDATTVVEDEKTETLSPPRLPIIVVGNKVDLLEAREVGEKRGYEVANEYSCMFIEASAKMSINVEKAIYDVVKVAVLLKQKGYDNAPSTWNFAWETLI
ncbi:T-complex protein 11-domain-containing protein [Xylariaceae sp. FL0255]|nr:T-complex protein 11-domain-containing protein [Xylariaceae sp. FL0255]